MSNGKSKMVASRAFLTLFEEQENCDVFFQLGSDTIGAHKAFLQARSQVLYEWASAAQEKPIPIDGLSFEVFKAVLSYIYSDEITITNNNVFEFFFASKTYQMPHLEFLCAGFISSSLQPNTVCAFMSQAVDFNATAFQDECRKIFSAKTSEILARPEFLSLSQPALSSFLDVGSVNVLEIDLFLRVKEWMAEQCKKQGLEVNGANMRRVIGDALYKIHFPAMTILDFSNKVTTINGLLSDNEMLQTFRKISVLENDDIQCPFPENFRYTSTGKIASGQKDILNQKVMYHFLLSWFSVIEYFTQWQTKNYYVNKNEVQTVLQNFIEVINTSPMGSYVSRDIPKSIKDDFMKLLDE